MLLQANDEAIVTNSAAQIASGNPTVITLGASTVGEYHVIQSLQWSYAAAPTGGGLTIAFGGVTKWSVKITDAGVGFIPFANYPGGGIHNAQTPNEACVITLADGGADGELNVQSV